MQTTSSRTSNRRRLALALVATASLGAGLLAAHDRHAPPQPSPGGMLGAGDRRTEPIPASDGASIRRRASVRTPSCRMVLVVGGRARTRPCAPVHRYLI